jgi:hypothetical protein
MSQYEYLTINNEQRFGGNLGVSNAYAVTDALLEMKVMGLNTVPEAVDGLDKIVPKHIVTEIYNGIFDVEKDFYLPLKNPLVRRIFIFFENLELSKFPTFRKSTKVSLPLESFAMIVGDKVYPEMFFKGKIDDSGKNRHYLEELSYTLSKIQGDKGDIEALESDTIFNRMNYALKESTTEFITRKLYNLKSGDFFGFSDKTNRVVDAVFGVNEEVLSQFVLGFDLGRIERILESQRVTEIRFTFDYNKMMEYKNKLRIHVFSEYYMD